MGGIELKGNGFILSDHMIGLAIVTLGILFFLTTLKGFVNQKNKMEEKLIASRMICEYQRSHRWAYKSDYQIRHISNGLIVVHRGHNVLRISKENA